MNGRKMQKYVVMICLMAIILIMFPGCQKGKDGEKGIFGSSDKNELPEDTPWNHGYSAIMETDLGWYVTGLGEEMCLRYFDKETKNSIILCNKPECTHDGGNQCEATYQNLIVVNGCIYEGYLYILGWSGIEENDQTPSDGTNVVNLSLYRAALDGSSIDKVGTVFEVDNIQNQKVGRRTRGFFKYSDEEEDNSFIIHKGIAYVSYYLQLGGGSVGLRGGGLIKMDLSTGATKEIETVENLQQRPPALLSGTGDYVYYHRFDPKTRKVFWYRYVISEDKTENVDPRFDESEEKVFGKEFANLGAIPYFTESRSYWLARTYQEGEDGQLAVLAVDLETQKVIPEESFETQIPFAKRKYKFSPRSKGYYSMMHYDGKFFIGDMENVYVYDDKGNQAGEIAVPREKLNINDAEKQLRLEFKICNEKLYLIYGTSIDGAIHVSIDNYDQVLSCALSDVYQGRDNWMDVYRFQGKKTFKEYLMEQVERIINGIPEKYQNTGFVDQYREQLMGDLYKNYPEEFKE